MGCIDYDPVKAAQDAVKKPGNDVDRTISAYTGFLKAGATAVKDVPVLGTVVGLAAKATEIGLGLFRSLFGSKYGSSTGVRWLLQKYQKYVMGQNVNSDNKVDEQYLDDMYKWFTLVLGVPLYDDYRYHDLAGTSRSNAMPNGKSIPERVVAYMKYGDVVAAGVTYEQAFKAAEVLDKIRLVAGVHDYPGMWADQPVLGTWYDQAFNSVAGTVTNMLGLGDCNSPTPVSGTLDRAKDFFSSVYGIALAAVVFLILLFMFPFKKKRRI